MTPYTENTTNIVVQKREGYIYVQLKEGHQYIVELDNSIIYPPQDSSLHANWNHNIIPKDKIMQIAVKQLMGTMINFTGYGYDRSTELINSNQWTGWIPIKSLKVIREI